MIYRLANVKLLLALLLLSTAACTGQSGAGNKSEQAASPNEAGQVLEQTAEAMAAVRNYSIRMQLLQELTGESAGEKVKVHAAGSVSLNPLQMEQTVTNDIDGDVSEIRTILTPDSYYIYEPTIGVWNKLPKNEIERVREALSDFQVNPQRQAEQIRKHAEGFAVRTPGDHLILTLTETDKGAKELLEDLLKSTLNGGEMRDEVRDSIQLRKLDYNVTVDAKTHNLLRLDIVSDMEVQFEQGNPMRVQQTLAVKYGDFNTAKPITVPQEAKDAPEVMGPGVDIEMDPGAEEELDSP